jgi:hypothetical protein
VANVPRAVTQAQRTGAAPSTERLRLGFVLAHPHPEAEDALLRGLFDRSSPSYHHFVTPAQYAQRFGVSEATQQDVRTWLVGGGLRVEHVTGAGDYILASGTVAQVQALLKTTIGRYQAPGGAFDANDTAPAVPEALPCRSTWSTCPRAGTSRTRAATWSGTSTCRRSTAWRRGSPARSSTSPPRWPTAS